jgi:hypothetical protein
MNWYSYIDNTAKELAGFLVDNPEMEFEVQEKISGLPRALQGLVWKRVNMYAQRYLEQGGGSMEVFMSKEE